MKQLSALAAQKKKLLLVLPALAFPFITLALWALGFIGPAQATKIIDKPGINKQLPGAQLATGNMPDKMSLYDLAAKDSELLREQLQFAPDTPADTASCSNNFPLFPDSLVTHSSDGSSGGLQMEYDNPSETRLRNKLAELQKSISEPPAVNIPADANSYTDSDMELAYQRMQSSNTMNIPDPELEQLNGLLDKIGDIQNPGRAQQRLKEASQKNSDRVYAVKTQDAPVEGAVMQSTSGAFNLQSPQPAVAFYDLEESAGSEDSLQPSGISAAINETQTLVAGATVKMRLTQNVFVNGIGITSGSFVSGICTIEGERLKITISTIRYDNNILPVNLSVYDLDGLEGIRIPGAISRDAAKEGADRALQSVQLLSLDPSIGAQAAGAGVEAAKSFFSKKAKLVRVVVKAGHPVVLVDMKARQAQY